jgi:hypothetical protein
VASKTTKAVAKGAKTPTVKQLQAQVAALTASQTSWKHAASTAKTTASRKHDLAAAAALGVQIASDKHEIAVKQAAKKGAPLGDGLPCCAAQAVATSLRLAGGVVADEDIEALHWLAGGTATAGVPVLSVLTAARDHGLAGARPGWGMADTRTAPMILGLDWPGPHTVLAAGDTWWSWGEPWPASAFSAATVDQAWAVTWS